MCCLFFFFSSRRRHTRFDCDWSSDVCSSDLNGNAKVLPSQCPASWQMPRSPERPCTGRDRKSTRLNSSHSQISYAVFCLKKKNRDQHNHGKKQHTHIHHVLAPVPPALSRRRT